MQYRRVTMPWTWPTFYTQCFPTLLFILAVEYLKICKDADIVFESPIHVQLVLM